MVEPILTYAGQIFVTAPKLEKINQIEYKMCKEVIGVGRNCHNAAVLLETGWIPTSCKIYSMALNYFFKLKNNQTKTLQYKCFDYQINHVNESGIWVRKMLEMVKKLGLNELLAKPYNKTFKCKIFNAIKNFTCEWLFGQMQSKSSLVLFNQLNHYESGAFYLKVVNDKSSRRAISRFRLGEYLWKLEKFSDGTRKCPLCEQMGDFTHIIKDCKALDHARSNLVFTINKSVKEIFDSREIKIVLQTSQYLQTFFKYIDKM